MQCALCNKPLIVNAEESAPFSEGDFVTIPLSIPGIHPIFEIWERYICKSCDSVHYKIKLVSSEEKIPLPGELICPEQRLTLENSIVEQVINKRRNINILQYKNFFLSALWNF